ncbi:MAG: hypothetical protein OIN66_08220 [Candidatus Methanoperedens sp.]|nr:hypothetical protein [Candidatus Methanoperedens sp.]
MIKKMLTLLLLAVRWCSSSAPLSLIQRQISTVYYFGTAVPPKVIPWYNSRINGNIQLLIINNGGTVAYAVRETVSCLNWLMDDMMQGSRYYPVPGSRYDLPVAFRGTSGSQKLLFSAVNSDSKASGCPVGFI